MNFYMDNVCKTEMMVFCSMHHPTVEIPQFLVGDKIITHTSSLGNESGCVGFCSKMNIDK